MTFFADSTAPFTTTIAAPTYKAIYDRYRAALKGQRNDRIGWSDIFAGLSPGEIQRLFLRIVRKRRKPYLASANGVFDKAMPKPALPPVFPHRPLNLNEDGTTINYRKSHSDPHAEYWAQADSEEIERLFTSGTLRPLHKHDIPPDKTITYVNPVCSEKLRDSGEIKFRTRATIGGDLIDYPYSTTAVTANLESIKYCLMQ